MMRLAKLGRSSRRLMSSVPVPVPDLLTRLRKISSDSPVGRRMRSGNSLRIDGELFFGKQFGDDKLLQDNEQIKKAQQEVNDLLLANVPRPAQFAKLAHNVLLNCLEDKNHQFAVPSDIMFNGQGSPVGPLLDEALMKAFSTARCAYRNERENFSGFALAGTKGTGKTTLTRLVALLSGLLIPNFQSVFISLGAHRDIKIDQLVREAAIAAGIADPDGKENLGTVIGKFTHSKCGIGLFLDELPVMYTENNADWNDIHSILDSTEPTFVMANGSASVLPAMIKRDGRDMALLKSFVKQPLISLNGTKMQVKMLPRFTTREHYKAYLNKRKHLFQSSEGTDSKEDADQAQNKFIQHLHLMSGGVFRRMRQVRAAPERLSLSCWKESYPVEGTLEKRIFDKLAAKIVAGAEKADIFDMPKISEDRLEKVVDEYYEELKKEHPDTGNREEELRTKRRRIQDLVDSDTLQVIEMGQSRMFSFAIPAHFMLTLIKPPCHFYLPQNW
jgi:hypothetical protein